MVVLGNADSADIAVIASFWYCIFACKTVFFEHFLISFSEQFSLIFGFDSVWTFKEGNVEHQHASK